MDVRIDPYDTQSILRTLITINLFFTGTNYISGGQAATYHAQEGLFSIDPAINNTLQVSRIQLTFRGQPATFSLPSK